MEQDLFERYLSEKNCKYIKIALTDSSYNTARSKGVKKNNPNYEEWATNKGGYEVSCIGIDPRNGKVWLASGCYGYSTIDPPYQK